MAASLDDLKEKLALARDAASKSEAFSDPRGIYFAEKPDDATGKVAFLFPGQGSQYPDMLAQQAMAFPEVREVLDRAEHVLANHLETPLGRFIYPPSPFTPAEEQKNKAELTQTEVAQPAVGAASLGMARLLAALGLEPDFLAGHSYGEYVALAVAGAMGDDDLIAISHQRGRILREAASAGTGGMVAVEAPADAVAPVLEGMAEVWLANHNSPQQTVIAGTESGLEAAATALQAKGFRSQRIPVACAFHTPLIAAAKDPLGRALAGISLSTPRKPVFSNSTAKPHASEPAAITRQLVEHLTSPVRFADEVLAMYEAGARIFIEVGPQAVLTGLTGQILAGKPHLAVATDLKSRPGLVQLAHMLAQVLVAGVPARIDRLFQGRNLQPFDLAQLGPETGKPKLPPTTWVVNGVRSRPLNGPEPRLLGQALPSKKETAPAKVVAPPRPATTAAAPPRSPSANGASTPAMPATPKVSPIPGSTPSLQPTAATSMNHTDVQTPVVSATAPEGAAQVMMRFQEVMARFLDTQKSVMLSFLGSSAPSSRSETGTYSLTGTVTRLRRCL